MTQRRIVQTTDPYQIQEVLEKDGRIHWEIFGPYGFLSDHTSLADAEAKLKDLTKIVMPDSESETPGPKGPSPFG